MVWIHDGCINDQHRVKYQSFTAEDLKAKCYICKGRIHEGQKISKVEIKKPKKVSFSSKVEENYEKHFEKQVEDFFQKSSASSSSNTRNTKSFVNCTFVNPSKCAECDKPKKFHCSSNKKTCSPSKKVSKTSYCMSGTSLPYPTLVLNTVKSPDSVHSFKTCETVFDSCSDSN